MRVVVPNTQGQQSPMVWNGSDLPLPHRPEPGSSAGLGEGYLLMQVFLVTRTGTERLLFPGWRGQTSAGLSP